MLPETSPVFEIARSGAPGDLHLVRLIDRAFQATGHLSLRELDLVIDGTSVILRGKLPRYYLKQMAHAAIRAIPGIGNVHDEVEVV